ncbi:MAG: hypothetical protein ACLTBD_10700 [Clostridia bacterium]
MKQIVKDRFVGLQTYQGKISPEDNVCQVYSVSLLQWMENFSHCERVDEESSELCIGDLKNGFDLENAKKILNVAKITEKECEGMLVLQNVFSMCGKSWREWKDRSSQSFEMVQTIEEKCRRIHKKLYCPKKFWL